MGWQVEADFLAAVFEKLETVAWSTPVYYPNVTAPLPTEPHYRAAVLPVDGQNLSTCGKERRTWLFQVDAVVRSGVGVIKLAQMIDALNESFLVNSTIGQFRQTNKGNGGKPADDIAYNGWVYRPITYKFEVII